MDFRYMMSYYTPLNLEDFKETSFDPDLELHNRYYGILPSM